MIAVAPVLAAAIGALLARVYGGNLLAQLLQWSMLLLVVTIPIGAAMVVSAWIARAAEYRARREAGLDEPGS